MKHNNVYDHTPQSEVRQLDNNKILSESELAKSGKIGLALGTLLGIRKVNKHRRIAVDKVKEEFRNAKGYWTGKAPKPKHAKGNVNDWH